MLLLASVAIVMANRRVSMTNLGQLGRQFTLIALPLRLSGMDGSPARVVGIDAAFAGAPFADPV